MGKNPSLGKMEIYKNSTWQRLCTSSWNKDEERLTCKAMGYYNDGAYDNSTLHTDDNNTSNASVRYNCTTLTKCRKMAENKVQSVYCKGNFIVPQPHVIYNFNSTQLAPCMSVFFFHNPCACCPSHHQYRRLKSTQSK